MAEAFMAESVRELGFLRSVGAECIANDLREGEYYFGSFSVYAGGGDTPESLFYLNKTMSRERYMELSAILH